MEKLIADIKQQESEMAEQGTLDQLGRHGVTSAKTLSGYEARRLKRLITLEQIKERNVIAQAEK